MVVCFRQFAKNRDRGAFLPQHYGDII